MLAALRSHFRRSLGDTLAWMFGFVEARPAFLRPAFYGAFFIWALIVFRGGLIGVVGTVIKFTVAAWGYLVVLVYVIMPIIDSDDPSSLDHAGDWIFIGGFGLVLGIALAVGSRDRAT